MRFQGQHTGTVSHPFVLNAKGTTTAIEGVDARFTIYPRPLRTKMYINGPTEQIKAINILSANGQKVIGTDGYQEDGIDVSKLIPGVYVVAITTSNGKTTYEKTMKAN